MNVDKIGSALLKIYDELKDDPASKDIIILIDEGQSDEKIKEGIVAGVKRLRELEKNDIAEEIVKKTKGFAF